MHDVPLCGEPMDNRVVSIMTTNFSFNACVTQWQQIRNRLRSSFSFHESGTRWQHIRKELSSSNAHMVNRRLVRRGAERHCYTLPLFLFTQRGGLSQKAHMWSKIHGPLNPRRRALSLRVSLSSDEPSDDDGGERAATCVRRLLFASRSCWSRIACSTAVSCAWLARSSRSRACRRCLRKCADIWSRETITPLSRNCFKYCERKLRRILAAQESVRGGDQDSAASQ